MEPLVQEFQEDFFNGLHFVILSIQAQVLRGFCGCEATRWTNLAGVVLSSIWYGVGLHDMKVLEWQPLPGGKGG